jgi:hypothetical protein
VAKDDPGRKPFAGSCEATCTAKNSGFGEIGPVPKKRRLVVEAVSAQLVTSTSRALYTMQINGPFTLLMIPSLITDGPFKLSRYFATHSIRFYVEAGESIQFQIATTGASGQAACSVSGYLLDV